MSVNFVKKLSKEQLMEFMSTVSEYNIIDVELSLIYIEGIPFYRLEAGDEMYAREAYLINDYHLSDEDKDDRYTVELEKYLAGIFGHEYVYFLYNRENKAANQKYNELSKYVTLSNSGSPKMT